jgi:casein kinase 1
MNYVRKLGFDESPDYDFLRELFSKVIKTLGEPDDGVYDWMLLNGGKGWEASNVSPILFRGRYGEQTVLKQSSSALLAQAHAAATPRAERKDREGREHGRRRESRQHLQDTSQSSPLVLSPTPARIKDTGRRNTGSDSRANSRDLSVQPLAPASRRVSQQQMRSSERARESATLPAPHPFATAPSPSGYRTDAYGRTSTTLGPTPSPAAGMNGSNPGLAGSGSDPYTYGGTATGTGTGQPKAGSREGTMTGTREHVGTRGMGVYDQMGPVREQEEGHGGKRKGFWSMLCCSA